MANTTPSPYMDMQIPTPAVAPGPEWATLLNECLLRIDQHTHIPGNGFPLSSNSITINADLPFNSHNATLMRSVRFINNTNALATPTDLGCIYEKGGDFYYNNSTGTPVQITNGTGVAGSPGTIGSLVAPASATYVAATSTFVFQSAALTAANLDARSITLKNSTPSSFGYTLSPPNAITIDTFITLPNLPATTNVMTLSAGGVMNSVSYDFVGQSMSSVGANAIANSRTRATGTAVVGLGGVAITNSCGEFHTTSTTEVDVTNLFATIATSGRPISVKLIGDVGNSNFSATNNSASFNAPGLAILILRRISPAGPWINILTTNVGAGNFVSGSSAISFLPTLEFIDVIGSGTFDYKVQLKRGSLSFDASLINVKLVVYEL